MHKISISNASRLVPLLLAFLVVPQATAVLPPEELQVLQDFAIAIPALTGADVGWNQYNPDPCLWEGVTCYAEHVQQIRLPPENKINNAFWSSKPLDGTIPESIGNLSPTVFLHLSLFNNKIRGTLPASITNLTALQAIELHENDLEGSIPDGIWNLPDLNWMRFSGNPKMRVGPLDRLGNLVNMVYLDLKETGLNGTIPDVFDRLPKIQGVLLGANNLTGTIPRSLWASTNLLFLSLNENQLTGTIDPLFANLTKLKDCDLSRNALTGTIPPGIVNWTQIEAFSVTLNQLSGTIPAAFLNKSSLVVINLSFNDFSGCVFLSEEKVSGKCYGSRNQNMCSCTPDICYASACPSCTDRTCFGATFFDGSVCDNSSQCLYGCIDGFCAVGSPMLPSTSKSIEGIVIGIVVAVVLVGIGAAVAFVFWRRHNRANKPSNAASLIWMQLDDRSTQSKSSVPSIPIDGLTFVQELGKGSSGTVHLATYQGEFVAVKRINSKAAGSDERLKSLQFEADVMASIRSNRNVVNLIAICEDPGNRAIVMEFCPRGSLSNYLKKQKSLSEYEMFKYTYGIASGMAALAMANVVHRDLACRNVLLSEHMFAKVSDFGYASKGAMTHRVDDGDSLGPVKWQSPEVLRTEEDFSEKSDVWAFGCTMIEILTCSEPYAGYRDTLLQLVAEIRDSSLNPLVHILRMPETSRPDIPEWMYSVLQSCFKPNPAERPTFREVRYHLSRAAKQLQNQLENEEDEADTLLTSQQYVQLPGSQLASDRATSTSTGKIADQLSQSASSSTVFFRALLPNSSSRIDLEHIERLGKLGSGAFGAVYLGISQGAYVALKVLSVRGGEQEAVKEASLMMNIQPHRNIIQLYGMVAQDNQLTIVMEFAPKGALESLLKAQKANTHAPLLTEGLLFKWAVGIARGMAGLSASKIIHRDLAVRNILLDSSLEPKIADFGLARTVLDPNQESSTRTDIGPVRWFAPECYDLKYSEKTDVWAYGCTLVEILTAEAPFAHLKLMDVVTAVRDQSRTPLEAFIYSDGTPITTVPSWMIDTMRKCFAFDPKERATFAQLVAYLEGVGPTIREIREAEAEIQKRRDRRADIRSMQIKK